MNSRTLQQHFDDGDCAIGTEEEQLLLFSEDNVQLKAIAE